MRGGIGMWADVLIDQYKEGRKELEKKYKELGDSDLDKLDATQIMGMIESMKYSIDWMETGRQPDSYRGVDKRDIYRISQYEDMDIIPDITEELRKEREPLYMDREQRQALIKLFERFSDRERQCFLMYEAEGLSMQKIADKLEISKWTVRTYIDRAKDKVKEITG